MQKNETQTNGKSKIKQTETKQRSMHTHSYKHTEETKKWYQPIKAKLTKTENNTKAEC